ncbi:MAG: hypothetical protein ACPMAG_14305, partial [Limisphaerales bacterium]
WSAAVSLHKQAQHHFVGLENPLPLERNTNRRNSLFFDLVFFFYGVRWHRYRIVTPKNYQPCEKI